MVFPVEINLSELAKEGQSHATNHSYADRRSSRRSANRCTPCRRFRSARAPPRTATAIWRPATRTNHHRRFRLYLRTEFLAFEGRAQFALLGRGALHLLGRRQA